MINSSGCVDRSRISNRYSITTQEKKTQEQVGVSIFIIWEYLEKCIFIWNKSESKNSTILFNKYKNWCVAHCGTKAKEETLQKPLNTSSHPITQSTVMVSYGSFQKSASPSRRLSCCNMFQQYVWLSKGIKKEKKKTALPPQVMASNSAWHSAWQQQVEGEVRGCIQTQAKKHVLTFESFSEVLLVLPQWRRPTENQSRR